MNDPDNPDPQRPPDVRPEFQFLDYRGRQTNPNRSRITGKQLITGFACWVGSVGVGVAAAVATQNGAVAFGLWCVIFVGATGYLGNSVGWRGFIPGLLIGAAFTCLVPVGILWVACANSK